MIKQTRKTAFAARFLPALFLLIFAAACEQPAGSPGNDPPPGVAIGSAAALAKIGADPAYPLNGAYTLTADLALDGWEPIGTYDAPFTGTFDGGGKTLTINGSGGIFGFTKGAAIRNVKAAGSIVKEGGPGAAVQAGGIAGHAENTAITLCVSSAKITLTGHGHNSSVGGIAGYMLENSSITDCSATGTITLRSGAGEGLMLYAGGISGYSGTGGSGGEGSSGCVISRCSYTGTVSAEGAYPYAGGIAGYNYTGAKISECFASGNITAAGENLPYAGGISGYNSRNAEGTPDTALIENCYTGAGTAVSAVSASKSALAGGIAGANAANARISGCYVRGDVTARVAGDSAAGTGGTIGVPAAANAGGIAGAQYFNTPVITNCAALNAALTGEDSGSGAAYNICRIAGAEGGGGGQLEANAANSAMALNGGARSYDKGPGGKDGEDCAAQPDRSVYEGLGWDFSAVWKMGAGGYPVLQWQD